MDGMSESEVQQRIQIEASYHKCNLMRNNSGALTDREGRQVRFGLGNTSKQHNDRIKSSDLVGFTVVTITPEMVGKKVAVLTAVEVKESEWKFTSTARERAQLAFIDWIRANGGIAGFARSIDDFKTLMREYLNELSRISR